MEGSNELCLCDAEFRTAIQYYLNLRVFQLDHTVVVTGVDLDATHGWVIKVEDEENDAPVALSQSPTKER